MRFAIIKNHKSSTAGVSNTIGWIEYNGMTDALLNALIELDYTIELRPSPKLSTPPTLSASQISINSSGSAIR